MDLPYQDFNPSGQCVMHVPKSCRYPRKIELSLMEAGDSIRLNGKKIIKSEVRKEASRK